MSKWKYQENYQACRLQVDFNGFLKLSLILGVCMGIGFIPIGFLANIDAETVGFEYLSILLFSIVGSPIVGFLFGVQTALLGYLPYKWLMNKTRGYTFTGKFVGLTENADE